MMKMKGLFLVAIFFNLAYTQLLNGQSLPGCQSKCGDVTIEYPFGTSPGCYYGQDQSFKFKCDETEKLVTSLDTDIEVINISHNGQLRAKFYLSMYCDVGGRPFNMMHQIGNLSLSTNNRLTLVGCNAFAFLTSGNRSTGCGSLCDSLPSPTTTCNGQGCCTTDVFIPMDVYYFTVTPYRFDNMTSVMSFNPCIYAFLVEDGKFTYSSTEDLLNIRNVRRFPVVLDWSIGNQTCMEVGNTNICGGNSICFDSTRGTGYNCKCLQGYEGNPYLPNGCQDIDECTNSDTIHRHNCADPKTCKNTLGGFLCKCKFGYSLDKTTMSCKRKDIGWGMILLGTTIGFLAILLGLGCIRQRIKYQKDSMLRQQFFEQNGGGMLIERLSGKGPSNVDVKIFTEESMKKSTNGYDESRILGQGGQGTVYKGILPDNSIVAIKKARLGDRSQVEQFINEVLVLSQVNHRNVVKLLGCCLETEVPLLVYEFINSGTLFDHLHGSLLDSSLTWEHRLRIATEIAGTLAYLHSSASIPIIHRDIKTANILLDENLTAKVADFGASRLIPMDKEQLTTMVQGTLGYLDPEYYNTGLLNEKSDVYSFGVVLMELLSGQKALCFERPYQSKHLVTNFVSAMKENRWHEVIDGKLMNEGNDMAIREAVRVAVECTRLTGEERPKMKEVASVLEGLRVTKTKHLRSDEQLDPKEIEHLLGVGILSAQGESSSVGYDSIKNAAILDIEDGR